MKRIFALAFAAVLLVEGLMPGVVVAEPAGQLDTLDFEYRVWNTYITSDDTFTSGEVSGDISWMADFDSNYINNPIREPQLRLDTSTEARPEGLELDWQQAGYSPATITLEGPPVYEWSFEDVPPTNPGDPEGTLGISVEPANPDEFQATFTPDFNVSRSFDNTLFSLGDGPQTQTMTLTITPLESMEGFLYITVLADDVTGLYTDEYNLVEAGILSFTTEAEESYLDPDGNFVNLYILGDNPGEPVTTTIEIEVTPNVPRTEYKPAVSVSNVIVINDNATPDPPVGNTHSIYWDPLGTWTWTVADEWNISWTEIVMENVSFTGVQSDFTSFDVESMIVDFGSLSKLDKIDITGTFSLNEDASYNLALDDVSVIVDGVVVDIPAGSFRRIGRPGRERYVYTSKGHDWPKIHMVIDFDKGEWSLQVRHVDASIVDNSDGVYVGMSIGYIAGAACIDMHVDRLSYDTCK